MSVPLAYLTVVLIWSTTPLGIAWSSETVTPMMAVLLRMVIAAVLGFMGLRWCAIKLPMHRTGLKLYGYSVIGIFGGMLFSYLSASYISTGMISLVFGLSPIISGILSRKILATAPFSVLKKFAMLVAFIGLAVVFSDGLALSHSSMAHSRADSWLGLAYILLAVSAFSLSGVLVKSVEIDIHPLATTVGALILSVPLFFLTWLVFDASMQVSLWSVKSLTAIVYLGLFGSLVGFVAYFYVLQKLLPSTVALITMITPVIAIILGSTLNNEVITLNLVYGAGAIILGLALYQWDSVTTARKAKALAL